MSRQEGMKLGAQVEKVDFTQKCTKSGDAGGKAKGKGAEVGR